MSRPIVHPGLVLLLLASACVAGCFRAPARNAFPGGPEVLEGGVIFRYYDPQASRVNLVGDFNNWSLRADPMVDKNGDGQWTLFYDLPPGVYQYKFVVDGIHWVADPRNPDKVSDGFEGGNSVVRVGAP